MRLCSDLKILSKLKRLGNAVTSLARKVAVKERTAVNTQKLILSKMSIRVLSNFYLMDMAQVQLLLLLWIRN